MSDKTEKVVFEVGKQTAADMAQSLRDMARPAPKPPPKTGGK